MIIIVLRKILFTGTILLLLCGISSCKNNSDELRRNRIITGISADFDYLNPLLIQLSMSREVCSLLYPSLVKAAYDEKNGTITFVPNTIRSKLNIHGIIYKVQKWRKCLSSHIININL